MPIQIVITLTEDGKVNVTGSIADKMIAFGLLEVAKETISLFHQQNQNKIQPVTTLPFLARD